MIAKQRSPQEHALAVVEVCPTERLDQLVLEQRLKKVTHRPAGVDIRLDAFVHHRVDRRTDQLSAQALAVKVHRVGRTDLGEEGDRHFVIRFESFWHGWANPDLMDDLRDWSFCHVFCFIWGKALVICHSYTVKLKASISS